MIKDAEYVGLNVLITGINGFIGGNIAKYFVDKGASVFGIIRNKQYNSFLYYEGLNEKVTLIEGDILDKELMSRIISEEQINYIYHLAAQVEVGVGAINPYLTFEANIKGTYTILESARLFPQSIKAIIIASTDKAYGSYGLDEMPYKEDYPLKPEYPYDISKACADMVARAYSSELYKLPVVVTRFCNIYGPGQLNFSALIPDAIRSALGYTTFIPRGSGHQIRDFIYVDDVVSLYAVIAEKLSDNPSKYRGEVYNAGTNTPISVRSVINNVYTTISNKDDLKIVLEQMEGKKTIGEIEQQYMDYQKVNDYFNWEPKNNLHTGLELTVEWFKDYLRMQYKKSNII